MVRLQYHYLVGYCKVVYACKFYGMLIDFGIKFIGGIGILVTNSGQHAEVHIMIVLKLKLANSRLKALDLYMKECRKYSVLQTRFMNL